MGRTDSTPAWLWVVGVLFVVSIAAIVVISVRQPDPLVFNLSRFEPRDPPSGLAGPDTVTLDARSGDRWTLLDLESGAITVAANAWDIGVKRHRLVVNGGEGFAGVGGVQRVEVLFDDLSEAPASGYDRSHVTGGGDTINATLDDWYSYDFFSHLLEPMPDATFVVRTAEGNYAKLRVLSYYCPGPEPGCLTIEYSVQGNGSSELD
ncbi:MAG: hypothetical protein E4H28_00690 [Gemmatimonadales bacterium]|nr:MAG: hypothetical protein E4H28_00690 [Gemmatimonadales bacterium]